MKLLILGGAGFVGTNLVLGALHWEGVRGVTVLDVVEPVSAGVFPWDDARVAFRRGDVRDAPLMAELVAAHDVIVNCAAQTSHPRSMQDPLEDASVNVLGNLTVLEAVRRANPRARCVYVSTSTVVGRAQTPVVTEAHGEWALDIYSSDKAAAEKHCFIYAQVHGLKVLTLRFANLYGPFGKNDPAFGFLNYFIALAQEGRDITVYGAGDQQRNVMYVRDAVACMRHCLAHDAVFDGTPYFAVHDEHLSVNEIARGIVAAFGRGRIVERAWPAERAKIDVGAVTISGKRLRDATGWRARYGFSDGLRETRATLEQTVAGAAQRVRSP